MLTLDPLAIILELGLFPAQQVLNFVQFGAEGFDLAWLALLDRGETGLFFLFRLLRLFRPFTFGLFRLFRRSRLQPVLFTGRPTGVGSLRSNRFRLVQNAWTLFAFTQEFPPSI